MKNKYLNQKERLEFSLSQKEKEILTGLILGDLFIEKSAKSVNARLMFPLPSFASAQEGRQGKQGICHEEYLRHLYNLFKTFCPQGPKLRVDKPHKRTGKVYSKIYFNTYSLPCFNELYDLFYLEGLKIVPKNIGDLLTPLGLCYWICDDGYWNKNSVYLCTNSFS